MSVIHRGGESREAATTGTPGGEGWPVTEGTTVGMGPLRDTLLAGFSQTAFLGVVTGVSGSGFHGVPVFSPGLGIPPDLPTIQTVWLLHIKQHCDSIYAIDTQQ